MPPQRSRHSSLSLHRFCKYRGDDVSFPNHVGISSEQSKIIYSFVIFSLNVLHTPVHSVPVLLHEVLYIDFLYVVYFQQLFMISNI
jgi:hypothetical protein